MNPKWVKCSECIPVLEDKAARVHTGMTLLDYFAVHASKEDVAVQIGILRDKVEDYRCLPANYTAIARYMHAAAMIEVRKKHV